MLRHLIRPLVGLALSAGVAQAQYTPYGPQQNVSLNTITSGGWTMCYSAPMATFIGSSAQHVLNSCQGTSIMMAGRATGSTTFLLLAAANYVDATFDTGINYGVTHEANGAEWYFSSNYSWGFAGLDDAVYKNQCDTNAGVDRMCLHTVNLAGGYRIGALDGLNGATEYEKVFFVSDQNLGSTVTPEPSSVALMAAGMFGVGLVARRRRGRA